MSDHPVGIQDEFTEIIDLGDGRFTAKVFTRSADARGPFRFLDSSWGALRDHFDAQLVDGCDITFLKGADGVRLSFFVKFGPPQNQDLWLRDVLAQFPDLDINIDFDRHELKYSATYTDVQGRIRGIGFIVEPIGNVELTHTVVPISEQNSSGEWVNWDLPSVLVQWQDEPDTFLVGSWPLFQVDDEEWRPYLEVGTGRIRIDLSRENGRVIDIDPTTEITGDADLSVNINYHLPSSGQSVSSTSSSFKTIGRDPTTTPDDYFAFYDRFATTAIPSGASVSEIKYWFRTYISAYTDHGAGPSNSWWRMFLGWNILSDPLVVGDLWSVRDQSGSLTRNYDDSRLDSPGGKVWIDLTIGFPAFWFRQGGATEIHDIEMSDLSAYILEADGREWYVYRKPASSQPYLEITYTADIDITMGTASVASSAPSLTVTLGAVSTTMNPASFVASAGAITVVPGTVTINMNPASFAASAPTITVEVVGGPISIPMQAASFVSSAGTITVVPGTATVTMQAASFASSAPTITVVPGETTVQLQPASAAFSAGTLAVTVGVTIDMQVASATVSAETITFVLGAVSVPMQAASAAFSAPLITVHVGAVGVVTNPALLYTPHAGI